MPVDAVSGATQVGGSTLTWAHTVAAGGVLTVAAGVFGDGRTVTGVTCNGAAMTALQASIDNSGGVAAGDSLWALHNPTSGNIVVTLSAVTAGYIAGIGVSYTGIVNSSVAAMHRTVYNGGAGGGGSDITVTDSQSGDLVVNCIADYTAAVTAGQTSRRNDANFNGSGYNHAFQDTVAAGASTVMTWTNDNFCTLIATALIPSGGGGGGFLARPTPMTRQAVNRAGTY